MVITSKYHYFLIQSHILRLQMGSTTFNAIALLQHSQYIAALFRENGTHVITIIFSCYLFWLTFILLILKLRYWGLIGHWLLLKRL